MHFPTHEQKQALLEPGPEASPPSGCRATAAREARDFIGHYYHHVDAEDLAVRNAEDLYGAPWRTSPSRASFRPGMPKIRVYNPRPEEHGWSSPHTVIEMVNDDMPFLGGLGERWR
jgi:glutamate dehydrogenase